MATILCAVFCISCVSPSTVAPTQTQPRATLTVPNTAPAKVATPISVNPTQTQAGSATPPASSQNGTPTTAVQPTQGGARGGCQTNDTQGHICVYAQHIMVIVLENNSRDKVLAIPYFKQLADRGVLLSNYHGVTHPSQPNYIAMIAGDTYISDDGNHDLPQNNLVDLFDAAGATWKAYMEDYPGKCYARGSTGLYARRHNPFISFNNVRTNPARCSQLVNAAQLAADVAADQLPDFLFYVPNVKNDGHDTTLAFAADWLSGFLEPKLANAAFMNGTLIVVTFDEDDGKADNQVYTVLLGPMVHAGSTDATLYTHYSLLRTIEDNYGLGTLNLKDALAAPFAACNFGTGCH